MIRVVRSTVPPLGRLPVRAHPIPIARLASGAVRFRIFHTTHHAGKQTGCPATQTKHGPNPWVSRAGYATRHPVLSDGYRKALPPRYAPPPRSGLQSRGTVRPAARRRTIIVGNSPGSPRGTCFQSSCSATAGKPFQVAHPANRPGRYSMLLPVPRCSLTMYKVANWWSTPYIVWCLQDRGHVSGCEGYGYRYSGASGTP